MRPSLRKSHLCHLGCAAIASLLLAGCSALKPEASPPPPAFSSLDAPGSSAAPAPRAQRNTGHTVVVQAPHAAAGYDSQKIIYLRQPHKLEYFAHSEWVDPPARMLAPMIVAALEASGAFRAVVSAPGSASGDLRLETEVLLLQHDFTSSPSQVRFALRAYLAEEGTRRVVATRDFEAAQPSPGEDPYGGVQAANTAARVVLQKLAEFCAETAAQWQPVRRMAPAR